MPIVLLISENRSGTFTGMVGIVVPAYKEGLGIQDLLKKILLAVPDAKVVVVDDSPDTATADAVNSMNLGNIKLIRRDSKQGRGSAVIAGLRYLLEQNCSQFIEIDADLSHPPSQIQELLRKLESENLGLVIASRYLPESSILNWPIQRRIFSKAANFLARTLLAVPITDYTNGFRCYSRAAAQKIVDSCGRLGAGFIALSEILVNLYYTGYKVGEVPTIFANRVRGESSVSSKEIFGALAGLWKIYLHKRTLQGRQS